jgi:PAS domain S-box-containing protein
MLGYTERELEGSSTRLLYLSEEDFDQVARIVAIIEQGLKDTASIETRFRCKDGRVIDVLLISTCITTLDKQPGMERGSRVENPSEQMVQAINFTILDITERKRMERELRDSEVQYRTIFENTGTAMVIIEEDSVVSLANAQFAALVGVSRAALEGKKKWTAFFTEDVQAQMKEYGLVRRFDSSGAPKSFESRLLHTNGRFVDVFITVVIIPGTIRSVASVIDLTEQKKMEKELFTAKKMEIIGQLAGGVAHEVRNPLNAILSISEALFQEEGIAGRPEYQEYIEHIRTQVNRLSKLMTDLLGLGKPSRSADIRPVPLERLCINTIKLWKLTKVAQDYPVTFLCDLVADQLWVLADSMRLQQALLNLMDNAAQCSPKGSGIILHIVKVDQLTIALQVKDAGVGIAQEKFERIFEPFFTLRAKGTGLGLTLVKHFVESMGGEILIRNNEPAPGCTAELILNLAEPDDYEHETEDIAC